MHASVATTLLLHTPSSTIPTRETRTASSNVINHPFLFSQWRNKKSSFPACRATSGLYNSPILEFNLYELLGVEASSDRAQIKEAYRALQKRCHPDIAGAAGHDMAVVLNEAYALLSDPNSRLAYDKELAKVADLQGYTGRPIYSAWFGSESEQRAVFVDEVKCVGCLKCALFAEKTFAIESVYGRARVVAQWADPEHKIQEAIDVCPVDCISIVERSSLAALEFIMSKQPRGKVRIGASNTAGARTSDVFDEVEKFQARYAKHKAFTTYSKESEAYRSSTFSAIQAIQMISNWLYWQSPSASAPPTTQNSPPGARKHANHPSLKKLKAAAERRKQAATTSRPNEPSDQYWAPSAHIPTGPTTGPNSNSSKPAIDPTPAKKTSRPRKAGFSSKKVEYPNSPLRWGVPMGVALVAATFAARLEPHPVDGVRDHVGGALALAIVNSWWLQVGLAGLTWYLIGMYVVELVEGLRRK